MHHLLLITLLTIAALGCTPHRRSQSVTWLPAYDSGCVDSPRANEEQTDEFVRRALAASKAGYLNQPHRDGSTTSFSFGKCEQGLVATRPFQSMDGNFVFVIVTEETPSPVRFDRGKASIYFKFDSKTSEVVDCYRENPPVH